VFVLLSFFSSSAAQIDRLTNFILGFSDLILRTSTMPNNSHIQSLKLSSKYFSNNRSQSRPFNSLNPNPVDSKYVSSSKESVYKPIFKPELQCETEPERTLLVPTIQDLIYNPYIFRAAISLPHTSKAPLFIRTNITDFLKRFKNMATNYEFSDNRKIRRVQKYYEFDII